MVCVASDEPGWGAFLVLQNRSLGVRQQLAERIAALPADHWKADQQEADAIREWAEVNYLPSDGIWRKDAVSPRRYLASFYR